MLWGFFPVSNTPSRLLLIFTGTSNRCPHGHLEAHAWPLHFLCVSPAADFYLRSFEAEGQKRESVWITGLVGGDGAGTKGKEIKH